MIEPSDAAFPALRRHFGPFEAVRSVIRVALTRVADSCGYGVPLYHYEGERTQLVEWARRKGAQGAVEYRRANNRASIDGLPGLRGDG